MFPNAVNSLDRFHLIQEFNRRLERIRIDAMNRVKPNPNFKETNHSSSEITKHREMEKQYYVLKKFNWLLLKNDNKISDLNMKKKYNRVLERYYNYYDLVEYMIKTDSQLTETLYLKDELKQKVL
ncbi:transposase [Thomasclavelia cocleata]|uniref:transposase n=1 Tax=Thomasclavelia cocleata TaxID=69824 RepID=UPI00242E024D|nr:transposase [Thomasclavelia cocleata]